MLPWDPIFTDLRGLGGRSARSRGEVRQSRLTVPLAGPSLGPRGVPLHRRAARAHRSTETGAPAKGAPRPPRAVRLPPTQSRARETPGGAKVGPEGPGGEAGRAARSPVRSPCESGRRAGTSAQPGHGQPRGQEPVNEGVLRWLPGLPAGLAAAELQQCHRVAARGAAETVAAPTLGRRLGPPHPSEQREQRGSLVCGQKGEARSAAPLEGSQHIYMCCLHLKGQPRVAHLQWRRRRQDLPWTPRHLPSGQETGLRRRAGLGSPRLDCRGTGMAWAHPSPLSFSTSAPPSSSAPGTPTGPRAPQGWAQPEEHTRGWGIQSDPAPDVSLPSFCGLACSTEGSGPGWPPARLHFLRRKSLSVSGITPGPAMPRLRTAWFWSLGLWAPPQEPSQ